MWDVGSNQHQKKKISISSQTLLVYRLFAIIERIGLSNTQSQQGYRSDKTIVGNDQSNSGENQLVEE